MKQRETPVAKSDPGPSKIKEVVRIGQQIAFIGNWSPCETLRALLTGADRECMRVT